MYIMYIPIVDIAGIVCAYTGIIAYKSPQLRSIMIPVVMVYDIIIIII